MIRRARCGTDSGYYHELRAGEVTCTACLAAHAEATRTRYASAGRPPKRRTAPVVNECADCGAPTGTHRCRSCAAKRGAGRRIEAELAFTGGWAQRHGVWRAAA